MKEHEGHLYIAMCRPPSLPPGLVNESTSNTTATVSCDNKLFQQMFVINELVSSNKRSVDEVTQLRAEVTQLRASNEQLRNENNVLRLHSFFRRRRKLPIRVTSCI
jgi:hypothetical protein